MLSEADIEKIIYRTVMQTWHTAKHKGENAHTVAVISARRIMEVLKQEDNHG